MKISFVNVGPVRRADITLRPLVIFVGPNNTGKSVLATAIYASLSQTGVVTTQRHRPSATESFRQEGEISDHFNEYLTRIVPLREKPTYEQLPEPLREYFTESLRRSLMEYSIVTTQELARATGRPVQELRRVAKLRATKAVVEISSDGPEWAVRLDISSDGADYSVRNDVGLNDIWRRIPMRFWRRHLETGFISAKTSLFLLREVTTELIRITFRQVPQHSYYLPASRSGILQSRRSLAGSLVRRSSLSGLFDLQDSSMTGVITDFLGQVIELNPTSIGRYADEARELEADILRGQLTLPGEPGAYPELTYHTPSGDYPLANASSMVSELAPVVLYLRYLVRRNELLIIEEPETSLHPGMQVAFARHLVHLVNKGLRILVTTHSEFFLQEINNAIIAAGMGAAEAAAAGFTRDYVLPGSKVSAYFFDSSPDGTSVRRLPIDGSDGISDTTFSAVSEQLYNEAVALEGSAERAGDY